MAVTKFRPALKATSLLAALAFMVVGYQNCSVDLANTTPGASVSVGCEPSAQELADFQPIMEEYLLNKTTLGMTGQEACGQCHAASTGHLATSVFSVFEGDPASADLQKKNFCLLGEKAALVETKVLSTPSHMPGVYQPSEVQTLLDFVRAHY